MPPISWPPVDPRTSPRNASSRCWPTKSAATSPTCKGGFSNGSARAAFRSPPSEDETSSFYGRMVAELPEEGRALFARFLEIETGHGALAQAELDSLTKSGFCFDVAEFDLEAG